MNLFQKHACKLIIHSNAAIAAVGNAVPVPGLGYAADLITMTTMSMGLSAVLGGSTHKHMIKNAAIATAKRQLLKQPIKIAARKLSKYIPYAGPIIAGTTSGVMVESAGWAMTKELEQEFAYAPC